MQVPAAFCDEGKSALPITAGLLLPNQDHSGGRGGGEHSWRPRGPLPAATLPSLHGMSEYPSLCDIRRDTPGSVNTDSQGSMPAPHNISQLHLLKQYINKHRNATCCWALENKVSAAGLLGKAGPGDGQHDPAALPPALQVQRQSLACWCWLHTLPPRATTLSLSSALKQRQHFAGAGHIQVKGPQALPGSRCSGSA